MHCKMYLCVRSKNIMSQDKKTEEFYKKLRVQLYETASWPSTYLYKFIVPTDPVKINKIEDLFNNMGAVIETKESKYKEVADNIEGVISL